MPIFQYTGQVHRSISAQDIFFQHAETAKFPHSSQSLAHVNYHIHQVFSHSNRGTAN